MIHLSYLPDYYETIGRYFVDNNYGNKYDDPNITSSDTMKSIINDCLCVKDYSFTKLIPITIRSTYPLITQLFKYIGFTGDKSIFEIIKCIEIEKSDTYYISMRLFELREILRYKDMPKGLYNDFINIASHFPAEFFTDMPYVKTKFTPFAGYVNPTYQDSKNDVLFVHNMEILYKFIYTNTVTEKGYNVLDDINTIALNCVIRLKMDSRAYYEVCAKLQKSSIRSTSVIIDDKSVYGYFTCSLSNIRDMFKLWDIEVKYGGYSIALLYHCFKDSDATIFNYLKLDNEDEENRLIHYLVNDNAVHKG